MINILVADDHPIYLKGIVSIIASTDDMQVVGAVTNGIELLELHRSLKPDVMLTDLKMPRLDGIEAVKRIRLTDSDVKIICLSTYSDEELVAEMLQAGANSYLLKSATIDEIISTIREVMERDIYLNRDTLQIVANIAGYNPYKKVAGNILTKRELQVLELICQQLTAREIAEKLEISHRTVEQHKLHLQDKFNVRNSNGIVAYAIKHRIVKIKE